MNLSKLAAFEKEFPWLGKIIERLKIRPHLATMKVARVDLDLMRSENVPCGSDISGPYQERIFLVDPSGKFHEVGRPGYWFPSFGIAFFARCQSVVEKLVELGSQGDRICGVLVVRLPTKWDVLRDRRMPHQITFYKVPRDFNLRDYYEYILAREQQVLRDSIRNT